ncbi:sensor histidine kinase KdpD [Ralstonia flaminis]|jgi:two-component system sensor histidine kinase KdpD|uniref:histidine kinase n=1 Tax=Ralstonia flaminis TaxID=3058597 RepID=A0ABM9K5C5_9RALS|nr:sensor histidine kinase KdpD [Ralstonia sp. LMG 18101]CAJ0813198.1 Sensor protein KdpD [Ralstonia sp. LMG 18101]
MTVDQRPNPDTLLAELQSDQEHASRGKLRIYFGASAGVGKTYAMLSAAKAARAQGIDVIIGLVETHGRAETAALVADLEHLPTRQIEYKGRALPEFDLDAALARKPALILVDELAHSNVAGSRHPKRWQDIEDLLAAGIDVWTTVNVQHLDSLNEAVGSITGIRVWETVPDAVFDSANEVILVDLPADELLRRLAEGKVYMPEQAQHAARNFFRKGNLIALRELALRRTADRVDDDVQAYRRARRIENVWRTRETIVACLDPQGDGEQVIRSAARLAAQLECDWHAVAVVMPHLRAADSRSERLHALLKLAEDAGAKVETLAGTNAIEAITGYIRRHNITKAVIGRPPEKRWRSPRAVVVALRLAIGLERRLPSGDFAESLARHCPEVDVIRAAADPARIQLTPKAAAFGRVDVRTEVERAADAQPGWLTPGYLAAAVYVGIATALSSLVRPVFDLANIVMLFLAAVVAVAMRHGRGPAALASVLSVALFDFFFVPPRWSFAVSDVQYLLTFGVMLAVGLLVGQLTAGLREQAEVAVQREAAARALYEAARELSAALTLDQIVSIGGRFVNATFGGRCAFFFVGLDGRLGAPQIAKPEGAAAMSEGGNAAQNSAPSGMPNLDRVLADWTYQHGQPAGTGTHTLPSGSVLYLPLKAPMAIRGVLAVEPEAFQVLAQPDNRRQIDACATLVAIAIERVHYVEIAQDALVRIESERLRNSLLAAVSHDLRTPLTGLVGMAETLSRPQPNQPPLSPLQAEAAAAIGQQAQRMRTMVTNLLDMARLQNREVKLRLEWQSIEELIGAALQTIPLPDHRVVVDDMADLPLVRCDGPLMERVLSNLLENAGKFAPAGTEVHISAAIVQDEKRGQELRLHVRDHGPGVPAGSERIIFEKFTRGEKESATTGVGLGLAVCEAIVSAHNGRIWVEKPADGGACFVVALPAAEPPPVEVDETE